MGQVPLGHIFDFELKPDSIELELLFLQILDASFKIPHEDSV